MTARRPRKSPPPSPAQLPLLDYINSSAAEEKHAQRRTDAEAAIARLYREQAELIAADRVAPAEISAANAIVMEIAAEVTEIEEQLHQVMEAGGQAVELRQALAEGRSRMVDARSHLDRLIRTAADRSQRLSQITPDIESWDERRHQAGQALVILRKCRQKTSGRS